MTKQIWSVVAVSGLVGLVCAGCGGGGHDAPPTFRPGAETYRTVTAGLEAPRAEHTATRIGATQTVLVTGGETLLEPATRGAEVFDATSGTTRPVAGGLSTPRAGHFAVALADGRVLVGGGHDAEGRPLDSLEVYDPARDRFQPLAARLAFPRDRAGVAVVGSRLCVAGGRGQDTLEQVSLADFQSQGARALPGGPRVAPQVVALDASRLLVYGGQVPGQPQAVWCDLDADTQVAAANAELAREGTLVRWPALSRDGLLIVGGRFGNRAARGFQVVTPADAATDRARITEDLGLFHERSAPVALVDATRGLFVFGGTLNGLPVAAVERQAPSRSELLPSSSGGRSDQRAVALDRGVIVLVGGRGADARPTALIDVVLAPGAPLPSTLRPFDDAAQAIVDRAAREEAIATTRGERDDAAAAAADLRGRLAAARAELSAAEARTQALRAEAQEHRDAAALAGARTQQLNAELSLARQRLSRVQQDAGASQGDRAAAEATIADLERQVAAAEQAASAARARVAQLDPQILALINEVNALRETVRRLQG